MEQAQRLPKPMRILAEVCDHYLLAWSLVARCVYSIGFLHASVRCFAEAVAGLSLSQDFTAVFRWSGEPSESNSLKDGCTTPCIALSRMCCFSGVLATALCLCSRALSCILRLSRCSSLTVCEHIYPQGSNGRSLVARNFSEVDAMYVTLPGVQAAEILWHGKGGRRSSITSGACKSEYAYELIGIRRQFSMTVGHCPTRKLVDVHCTIHSGRCE